jgi:hypothetical protein
LVLSARVQAVFNANAPQLRASRTYNSAGSLVTQEHQTQAMEQLERFNAAQQIAAFKAETAMTQ